MKLICSKSDLLRAVNIVLKAVPSRTTMSILECILIQASSDIIKLTGNDTELGIETVVKGEILEEGKIALNARIFSDIIRKLPDNDVTIESNENFNVMIVCEKAKFTIAGKAGEDFSNLPYIEKNNFISDNENNKLMTGELIEVIDNEMKVVSLDGHRISIRKIELKENYEHVKVVVPGKTLSDISKILTGGTEDEVHIFFTNNHILFEFDNTIVVSRLIEGEYFKINQMLSSDYETKIVINKREMLDCIDRATLLVKEGDKKPIIINIKDNMMELKINSVVGSMDETVDIVKEGKDIMIGFNPKFLIDALRVIDDEKINVYLVNPKAPCFIRDDKESYVYLILPVNFNTI